MVDEYSKYPFSYLKTDTVTQLLKKMFVQFGLLEVLKTDNGTPMIGINFLNICDITRGQSQEGNTSVATRKVESGEWFMRTLGKVIKTSTQWKMKGIVIEEFLLPYRTKTP